MSKNNENKLVPKLRFPEFKNDGEWKKNTLDEIADFLKGKGISKADVNEKGKLPCIRYGELYTHYREVIKEIKSFTNISEDDLVLSEEDDVIIPSSGETKEDIATASCVKKKGVALGGDLNILRSNLDGEFLAYFLSHGVKKSISKIAQGDAVVHLYSTQLKKISINVPPKKAEQQKIASCLSSLDEVISAESQKLEVLKDHKKGLQQNLFPQEGETVPKFRFKEFEDSGEWVEKKLGEISENLNNKRVPITENVREKGNIPYYGASGIIDYVKDYIFDEELLCISEDGANLVMRNYPIAFSIKGKTWVNNHAHVLKFKNKATQTIIENYLNEIDLTDVLTGAAQPKLNRRQLDIIHVPLPPSIQEQQKIASTLSSIDELINAQKQKLEALQLHKKGLLQGLFPSITNYESENHDSKSRNS